MVIEINSQIIHKQDNLLTDNQELTTIILSLLQNQMVEISHLKMFKGKLTLCKVSVCITNSTTTYAAIKNTHRGTLIRVTIRYHLTQPKRRNTIHPWMPHLYQSQSQSDLSFCFFCIYPLNSHMHKLFIFSTINIQGGHSENNDRLSYNKFKTAFFLQAIFFFLHK